LPISIANNHATDTATGLEVEFEAPINTVADDPLRYIGNLGPGDIVNVFFFVDYSNLRADVNCANGIDEWYVEDYTVTLRSIDGSNSLTGEAIFDTDTFNSFSMISANAGGALASDLLGPGATVGQILTQNVTYDFGNNPAASQLFLQPSGNGATFRDDCFRLLGSEIIASNVMGVNVGVVDRLFFVNTDTAAGNTITIDVQWLILCSPGTTTQTFPWAEITSGTQFKYNEGGYAPTQFPLPDPVIGTISITKTVQVPANFTFGMDDPVVVTYTVEIANAFTMPVVLSTIFDQLDPNMSFEDEVASSDIDSANSTVSPNVAETGLLNWYGVPPDNSYIIPATGSLFLRYQVAIDYDENNTTNPQTFGNVVTAGVGSDTLGPVNATVTIEPGSILSIRLSTFGVNGRIATEAWLSAVFILLALVTALIYTKYRRRPSR
jgi:hypothetical protein